ncbi:MAG: zinc ABC transporter substrate-binding protein [Phaeospirillum sp.]|nr:zinc ABC transporter substrate-binding protein [Phaeospirillum sp.]
MRKPLLAATLLGLLNTAPALADAPPAVLVSIKPLHGLVAAVMKGVAEPGLIVSGANSPHGYAMKPSDMRALEGARLVVWVGKDFETWLVRPVAKAREGLAMQAIAGIKTLPTREGGVWEAHDHKDEADDIDGHFWLDPDNAGRLVDAVAARLKSLDPAHATVYDANAAETRQKLATLDKALTAKLTPLADKPYVVFHDAHHYFEMRYGLNPAGAITVDPERPPSAKRLAALRDRIKSSGAKCVFREPRITSPTVQTLAEASGARVGQLDPEGTLVPAGPDAYFTLMTGLGDSLFDCLGH